jgi:hypothetical protein
MCDSPLNGRNYDLIMNNLHQQLTKIRQYLLILSQTFPEKVGGLRILGSGGSGAEHFGCPEAISFVLMLPARPSENSLPECPLSEIHE